MSNQRLRPEFKDEAVRQIINRGYFVAEVSEHLGMSAHSLHKWDSDEAGADRRKGLGTHSGAQRSYMAEIVAQAHRGGARHSETSA